ncbi:unnamed protein product [Kluyveromyces dobzhanskii CBS 2104]|uniref:WGS project CCBQ000000000 data, contig 00102 n=1 Tax=Kluyveromyces dobzhanskii CBS 2104 TaxID=1427455 RepID=A0A0A8L745_9SACH|nr:unnamed protein product [Kluyveromyces dobzhanskii CBS 2104]
MSNPFDLLGNDVEDTTVVVSPPKELVKKSTSSKKADVPPPSADPSKARNNRPKATGNEAVIKDKSAGRTQNRNKDAPASTKPKRDNRKTTDRQNRTGKTDSSKKVKQGWGDDEKELEQEQAAIADVNAELAVESEEQQPADNKKSLKEYLEELKANSALDAPAAKKEVKFDGEQLEAKEKDVFAPATKVKKVKSKQLKTKQFLDFDVTFSDSLPKPRADRNTRGKRDSRDSRKPNPKQQDAKAPAVTHFPSLA